MNKPDLKDYISLVSLILSVISIGIVIFKEFFSKSKLEVVISNIIAIPYDSQLKNQILLNLILNDLLSSRPSEYAKEIRRNIPEMNDLILIKNRDLMAKSLIEYSQNLERNNQQPMNYIPELKELNEYIKKTPILLNLAIPLNIVNIGNNTGNVSTLLLQVISTSDENEIWLFTCYYEVNLELLKDPLKPKHDINLNFLDKIFPGINIPAKSSFQLNPLFAPMPIANQSIVNEKAIVPGKYKLQIFGYNAKGIKVIESKKEEWNIEEDFYGRIFDGFLYIRNLTISTVVSNHIKKFRS